MQINISKVVSNYIAIIRISSYLIWVIRKLRWLMITFETWNYLNSNKQQIHIDKVVSNYQVTGSNSMRMSCNLKTKCLIS